MYVMRWSIEIAWPFHVPHREANKDVRRRKPRLPVCCSPAIGLERNCPHRWRAQCIPDGPPLRRSGGCTGGRVDSSCRSALRKDWQDSCTGMQDREQRAFPPAPWKLRGEAVVALKLVPRKRVQSLVPADTKVWCPYPGHTVAILYLARYSHSPVGAYHEFIMAAAVVRIGLRI